MAGYALVAEQEVWSRKGTEFTVDLAGPNEGENCCTCCRHKGSIRRDSGRVALETKELAGLKRAEDSVVFSRWQSVVTTCQIRGREERWHLEVWIAQAQKDRSSKGPQRDRTKTPTDTQAVGAPSQGLVPCAHSAHKRIPTGLDARYVVIRSCAMKPAPGKRNPRHA